MKQQDVTLIIVLAFLSGVISFITSGMVFGRPGERTQKTEIVDVITADFPTPDPKYFNYNSIDPTQLIHIGNNENPNPFSGAQ